MSEMSTDDPGDLFIIHEAADAGDVEALRQLLEERTRALEQRRQQLQEAGEGDVALLGPELDHYIQGKDQYECTPLHIAILQGHVDCARCLVEGGADVAAECDGCPSLILAVCTAALPGRQAAALALVQLLQQAGADPMQRDDGSRLALHWSAELGLVEASQLLLAETAAAAAQLREQMAAAGETAEALAPLHVLQMQDMHGNNPVHCAARNNQAAVLPLLLEAAADAAEGTLGARNKDSFTPLAVAAYHGAAAAAELLLKAYPPAAGQQDRHGFNPATLAARRGFAALAAQIQAAAEAAGVSGAAAAATAPPPGSPEDRAPTLIVAPPQCEKHLTCPDPLPRGVCPPPENVERLRVLVDDSKGVLRCASLARLLDWELNVAPAPIADILRVHDWNYVRKLQAVCHSLRERPDEQGYLDADTAVSFHTFEVALRAAAAVCLAVDRVVTGAAANAFCAVRPPGHHAGPRGVVPSKKDPSGSHGFCLLNNVAIGAAYAMNVHRHRGIQRVAILDFDVHHGNGTRACVSNTAPGKLQVPFSTPMSEGVHIYNTYQPWFDTDDDDNILFASVQGYGPKSSTRPDVFVYPGSGATTDTQVLKTQRAAQQAAKAAQVAAAAAAAAGGVREAEGTSTAATSTAPEVQPAGQPVATLVNGPVAAAGDQGDEAQPSHSTDLVEEDPDREFAPTTIDDPPLHGPRLIEVGIKGPGAHPTLWRRAWRDKILPALANFKPDIIMVSAGFDAHRKDVINYRYIGVTEADYEWLTDQIVQVANRCCNGRVVSVLEGGYNINGGLVSAFARSVEAHVRGLAQPHSQAWDPEESRREREAEHRRKEERARRMAEKKAAAQARLARMEAAEAAAAAAGAAAGAAGTADGGGGEAAAEGGAPAEGGGRLKRRRTASVDYQALNAQLEAAAVAAKAAVAAEAPAGAENT